MKRNGEKTMTIYFSGNTLTYTGDTVLLYGDGLSEIKNISVTRLCDEKINDKPGYITLITPTSIPTDDQISGASDAVCGNDPVSVRLIQQTDQSVKFVIPESFKMGIYSVIIETGAEKEILYINTPSVKWTQGDIGECATPGGWLRICGEKLVIDDGETSVVFEKDGKLTPMEITKVYDAYSVEVKIPENFEIGSYKVYLTNGFGGNTAWSMPIEAKIAHAEVMPQTIFNVRDFGATGKGYDDETDAVKAALAAAKENGGGVVFFPRGRYKLTDKISIPEHTVFKGESSSRTQIFWAPYTWALGDLPDYIISTGSDVTIEDIEFRGTRSFVFMNLGIDSPNPRNIVLRRLNVNFQPLTGREFYYSTDLAKKALDEIAYDKTYFIDPNLRSAFIIFTGTNVSITDSYFYCPQISFWPQMDGVSAPPKPIYNFHFKGNTVISRHEEWAFFGYNHHAIIEDNDFNGITVGNAATDMYFARNSIHEVLHNDREAYTTDMSYSKLGTNPIIVNGCKITLDPRLILVTDRTEAPGLYITAGKGAGQCRRITKVENNVVTVDS
ncbi:MAG: hypothetical protein E7672_02745, partial [Ruminococcaceae bacterium]|nr:hypothetical protein [Oscillospiraceae bacterium]